MSHTSTLSTDREFDRVGDGAADLEPIARDG